MIRFYIDGTTGQKDGTEVTSINPITAKCRLLNIT